VIAIGSSAELDTQLEIALRLRFITKEHAAELVATIDRLQKLLYGLSREKERRLGMSIAGLALVFLLPFLRLLA
jgi:hypothetical protein